MTISKEIREAVMKDYFSTNCRKAGIASGKARMTSLSPEKRKEIAKKAASARWENHKKA